MSVYAWKLPQLLGTSPEGLVKKIRAILLTCLHDQSFEVLLLYLWQLLKLASSLWSMVGHEGINLTSWFWPFLLAKTVTLRVRQVGNRWNHVFTAWASVSQLFLRSKRLRWSWGEFANKPKKSGVLNQLKHRRFGWKIYHHHDVDVSWMCWVLRWAWYSPPSPLWRSHCHSLLLG